MAPPRKLRVGFILGRSFTLSAVSLFVDTLRLAGDELDRSGHMRADSRTAVLARSGLTLGIRRSEKQCVRGSPN